MVPAVLKELFVPGSVLFLLFGATVGTLLTFRKTHNGRAGRIVLGLLLSVYWIGSTPLTAVPLVRALTPNHPPVMSAADAKGATAIVVLGGGMQTYRSRGLMLRQGSREHSLRALEAARVYRVLGDPWVIVTGALTSGASEALEMAASLEELGVPRHRIVEEGKSRNTHDHATYVPPLLTERGITRIVLVTSRQHMARSLRAFRRVGLDPVPSSPDFFVPSDRTLSAVFPSEAALDATSALMYDLFATLYYRARGWL